MTEAPVKICKANFYFMCSTGVEIARKGYVCPKLPLSFLKSEYAYKNLVMDLDNRRAFKLVKEKDGHYKFRVEFIKEVGSPSYKNFNKY